MHLYNCNVIITGVCQVTGKPYELPPVPAPALIKWLEGGHIQDALPMLSPAQREFLMTGMSPEGWRKGVLGINEPADCRKVRMDLEGMDGNAFNLLGQFRQKALAQGWPKEEVEAVFEEAKGGDYDHLLQTLIRHTEP